MSSSKNIIPVILTAIVISLLFLTGCRKEESQEPSWAYPGSKSMGKTYYGYFDTISYVYSYAGESRDVFEQNADSVAAVLEKYNRLFDIYHEYEGINNLCTVNRNAGGEPVKVDAELIEFIEFAKEMYFLTDGKVNIALGPVLSIWHEARTADNHFVPVKTDLEKASEHVSVDFIEIDRENCTLRLTEPKASIDVGALGKGYATEKAAQFLESRGITSYVLNIGGNIRIVGTKTNGSGWKTGIRNPLNPEGQFALSINISDCSCVTSGTYERYFIVDGVKYHHIIDNETLFPADYFESVTVICHDSGLADALSTALFCMQYKEGRALVESLEGVDCIWITSDGSISYTEGISKLIVKQ